jgi:hypothetical protein
MLAECAKKVVGKIVRKGAWIVGKQQVGRSVEKGVGSGGGKSGGEKCG